MKKVLIITRSNDNECIHMVEESLKARNAESFRFDTDYFPTEVRLSLIENPDRRKLTISSSKGEMDLTDVTGVWYRRLNVGGKMPLDMDPGLRQPSIQESQTVFYGFLESVDSFVMDSYSKVRYAGNKQLQLKIARELGLEIPRTLITNDPVAVREFFPGCKNGMITKMMSSFAVYEDKKEKVVFTNLLEEKDIADMEGLSLCPMTFQENIPKRLELRITIVGSRVFSAAIDSQQLERSKDDWRKRGLHLIDKWEDHPLPPAIEKKLLKLMNVFGLNYGAIDMILTPDNRYVFLEINPSGEFFWLQVYNPKFPISDAIADVLLGGRRGIASPCA